VGKPHLLNVKNRTIEKSFVHSQSHHPIHSHAQHHCYPLYSFISFITSYHSFLSYTIPPIHMHNITVIPFIPSSPSLPHTIPSSHTPSHPYTCTTSLISPLFLHSLYYFIPFLPLIHQPTPVNSFIFKSIVLFLHALSRAAVVCGTFEFPSRALGK